MKIHSITLKPYKRFADLTITGIPETARLVVLAGPNGCGKSSLFDALHAWYRLFLHDQGLQWDPTYYRDVENQAELRQTMQVEFHGGEPQGEQNRKKAIYVRTAYRNDPEFELRNIAAGEPMLNEQRFNRIIENDASVAKNYQRLAAQSLKDLHESGPGKMTFTQYRKNMLGPIRLAMRRLFPDLVFKGIGNPLEDGTFRFDKGVTKGFLYKNLSGGEKAAFDLILDIAVKKNEYDDTVFCIDEPDAHMNTRLQAQLLEELLKLTPKGSQLWIATHSIGMMRRARDLYKEDPGQVAFLDFDDRDYDEPQVITPATPNTEFWQRVLDVALADMSSLVVPERVVICEGAPNVDGAARNAEHDARCLNTIFAEEIPEVRFYSGGNVHDVERDRLALARVISLVGVPEVKRLIDQDDRTEKQIDALREKGVRVLGRRNLECFLFDDEVLESLCHVHGKPDTIAELIQAKREAIARAEGNGAPPGDLKRASGGIFNAAKDLLQMEAPAANKKAFMRDDLAPLIKPDMAVHTELKRDIFG